MLFPRLRSARQRDLSQLQRVRRLSDTVRLTSFVDDVFSIVMTLMLLSIQVPRPAEATAEALWSAIMAQWPSLLSYLVSFMLIGSVWINHHRMFCYIVRTDHILMLLNVVMLLSIALIPVATALVSNYLSNPDQERVATLIYGSLWVVCGLLYAGIWHYARAHNLIDTSLTPQQIRTITRRKLLVPALYAVATALAQVNVTLSPLIYGVPALLYFLPDAPADEELVQAIGSE